MDNYYKAYDKFNGKKDKLRLHKFSKLAQSLKKSEHSKRDREKTKNKFSHKISELIYQNNLAFDDFNSKNVLQPIDYGNPSLNNYEPSFSSSFAKN